MVFIMYGVIIYYISWHNYLITNLFLYTQNVSPIRDTCPHSSHPRGFVSGKQFCMYIINLTGQIIRSGNLKFYLFIHHGKDDRHSGFFILFYNHLKFLGTYHADKIVNVNKKLFILIYFVYILTPCSS